MTTTTTCTICSGTGIDPDFLDPCAGCQSGPLPSFAPRVVRPNGPTEKQTAFFTKVVTELRQLGVAEHWEIVLDAMTEKWSGVSVKEASATIDYLLGVTKNVKSEKYAAARTAATADLAPGFYRSGDRVVKIVRAKAGHLYGTVLNETTGKFEYEAGAIRGVTPADRLSVEDAGTISKRTGRCIVCSKTLTNRHSVDAGIGPICAGKL